ncbi:MAG: PEP-CTERM sorting domain-containing protein [Verrucomicrobia bacterium]|nr:PEP-CTERM sorting domain-containing protein [Verrucomicrobiota bacterium]
MDTGPNYDIFGVDVGGLAGLTGELRFTAVPFAGGGFGGVRLDNIFFSEQPIPEPSVAALFAFGALVLGWRLVRQRQADGLHTWQP